MPMDIMSLHERDANELLLLHKHYTGMATAIAEELAARSQPPVSLGPGRSEVGAETPTEPEARSRTSHGGGDQAATARGRRRSVPTLDAVLSRATPEIQEAAREIINAGFILSGVGEPVPERPAYSEMPRYVRLVWGRKTFVYVNVRHDHLRIDLPISAHRTPDLQGEVRVRDVAEENPWKISLYVRRGDDVESPIDAIRYVHDLLEKGEDL